MKQTKIKKKKDNFNWKLVLISAVVIGIVYFGASIIAEKTQKIPRETLYCHFEKTTDDSIPRNECAYLKLVSSDLNSVNIDVLKNWDAWTGCSKTLNELPKCEGETYHFTETPLNTLCEDEGCNVDGVICGAYFVTYHDESANREIYETSMFTEPNLESEKKLMKKLDGCDT